MVKIQRSRSRLCFDLPTANNIFTSNSYKAHYRQLQWYLVIPSTISRHSLRDQVVSKSMLLAIYNTTNFSTQKLEEICFS